MAPRWHFEHRHHGVRAHGDRLPARRSERTAAERAARASRAVPARTRRPTSSSACARPARQASVRSMSPCSTSTGRTIQLFEVVRTSFGINANGGTARSQGVEWKFGYPPVTGPDLSVDGRVRRRLPDVAGTRCRRQRWRSFAVRAEVEHGAGRGLQVACVQRLRRLRRRNLQLCRFALHRFLPVPVQPVRSSRTTPRAGELQHVDLRAGLENGRYASSCTART